jgi:hypothetical protein
MKTLIYSTIIIFLLPLFVLAAMNSEHYQIKSDSINMGGVDIQSSSNYQLRDTLSETATGLLQSSNYNLGGGYRHMTGVGTLAVVVPETVDFEDKAISIAEQITSASIGDFDHENEIGIEVSDTRGTGAGWSATMTATHLTTRAAVKKLAGSNETVDFTGTYDGLQTAKPGTFIVEITASGSVGVAEFKWTDPDGSVTSDVTTAASVVLSNGISVTFGAATYAVGDKWSVGVDAFSYNYDFTKGLTVTPSVIYAKSGSLEGVVAGSEELMTGTGATSNAKTLMTADINHGTGIYYIDAGLSQILHANSLPGTYISTAIITVL